jgi:three-Cys-motif partner protein
MTKTKLQFDKIGYWSEIKLDIIKKYAAAYSQIFTGMKQAKFSHVYIDAFAGSGVHISRETGKIVKGSPINALAVEPSFEEYYFIDINERKIAALMNLVGYRSDIHIYSGDCNKILLEEVFPKIKWEDYRRGLCLLDPYGLHLNWEVIQTAGNMRTIDMFLNFPIMDMNMNALWRNPEFVTETGIARMDAFWGDDSWRSIAYKSRPTLFGQEEAKSDNEVIAEGFRERLVKVANFKTVLKPMPMRNKNGAVVYYLFFASQKPVAENIVKDIFSKYQYHRYN